MKVTWADDNSSSIFKGLDLCKINTVTLKYNKATDVASYTVELEWAIHTSDQEIDPSVLVPAQPLTDPTEAENALNRPNLTAFGVTVNAFDYGLATRAADMRSLNFTARFRF